jgi:hypothetical protein
MRYEEVYMFQIKRMCKNTGRVLKRFIKVGKATKPLLRLERTKKDNALLGGQDIDFFYEVTMIWKSTDMGMFWDSKLTTRMEKALRRKCFQKFAPYVGEGIGKTEMFFAGSTTTSELKELIRTFMNEIIVVIRCEEKIIVNETQLDNLFKQGKL